VAVDGLGPVAVRELALLVARRRARDAAQEVLRLPRQVRGRAAAGEAAAEAAQQAVAAAGGVHLARTSPNCGSDIRDSKIKATGMRALGDAGRGASPNRDHGGNPPEDGCGREADPRQRIQPRFARGEEGNKITYMKLPNSSGRPTGPADSEIGNLGHLGK